MGWLAEGCSRSWAAIAVGGIVAIAMVGGGCGKPNFANIGLRKKVAKLEKENARLKTERLADHAATRPVEFGAGAALHELVTMAGMKFSRLTAVEKTADGSYVLKLYVVPNDERGDTFKTAGDVLVNVSGADKAELAKKNIGRDELADCFFGTGVLYTYILDVPLKDEPKFPVTVDVEFVELLSGRVFKGSHTVKGLTEQPSVAQ